MAEKSQEPNLLSLSFIEGLYAHYLENPSTLPEGWRRYFDALSAQNGHHSPSWRVEPSFRPPSLFNPSGGFSGHNGRTAFAESKLVALSGRIDRLIQAYRTWGHLAAHLDPLGTSRPRPPELNLDYHGLSETDLDHVFPQDMAGAHGGFLTLPFPGTGPTTLRQVVNRLKDTYCRSIGVEYMYIDHLPIRTWIQERMERTENRLPLEPSKQVHVFTLLAYATLFESFLQKKFLGAKTFSLEGSESLIPLLSFALEKADEQNVEEIVLAMAHRGRLNVLTHIMGKSPRHIFREFEDSEPERHTVQGDVKYHLGHSTDWVAPSGRRIHLTLCFNPSHLEFINPVAMGRLRAKQDRHGDFQRERCLGILMHGDAAFAGEGVVQETLNLSQLQAYHVGGLLHVVVNNQLGFTTLPEEGRSTVYATDVAKMLQIPIFHVNGEDLGAVAQGVVLAMDFKKTFRRDVVIDLYGYRVHGHNESDEPTFTQPVMYQAIRGHRSVGDLYLDTLFQKGILSREEADAITLRRQDFLEQELSAARSPETGEAYPLQTGNGLWAPYLGGLEKDIPPIQTGVPRQRLAGLLEALTCLPTDFHPHPKIERGLEQRRQMAGGEKPLDWAAGEALALATLATDQRMRIRLCGQDSGRGTFSHRHAILYDTQDGHPYIPLQHLSENQAPIEICNSPLSELGVMGFEYGYSLDFPDGLTLWEAQFGDFSNAAQVIIDQFIAGAEKKWRRLSGLVLLLPHGSEGLGPEHSSARLERFLMLTAEDNIQVVQPSTPAQFFHVLRRQALRVWRKPLIIMTPKSLLRHPRAVSSLDDFAEGKTFERILPDSGLPSQKTPVQRILLTSGKIYYDLLEKREKIGGITPPGGIIPHGPDVALLRLEQFYPLPEEVLRSALAPYSAGIPVFWVQEEPENMGAWPYLSQRFGKTLPGKHPLAVISRPSSASPATGSAARHVLEQQQLLGKAFSSKI